MKLTIEDLKLICPQGSLTNMAKYVAPMNDCIADYGMNTLLRASHFIAQVAHESGQFNYVREIASGSAYEGRKDLGNVQPGDGVKFKGRGLIQITGRSNYQQLSDYLLCGDLLRFPELLEEPKNATSSAAWFWTQKQLNLLADRDDIMGVTKRINGGYNGLANRKLFLARAKSVLSKYYK